LINPPQVTVVYYYNDYVSVHRDTAYHWLIYVCVGSIIHSPILIPNELFLFITYSLY